MYVCLLVWPLLIEDISGRKSFLNTKIRLSKFSLIRGHLADPEPIFMRRIRFLYVKYVNRKSDMLNMFLGVDLVGVGIQNFIIASFVRLVYLQLVRAFPSTRAIEKIG